MVAWHPKPIHASRKPSPPRADAALLRQRTPRHDSSTRFAAHDRLHRWLPALLALGAAATMLRRSLTARCRATCLAAGFQVHGAPAAKRSAGSSARRAPRLQTQIAVATVGSNSCRRRAQDVPRRAQDVVPTSPPPCASEPPPAPPFAASTASRMPLVSCCWSRLVSVAAGRLDCCRALMLSHSLLERACCLSRRRSR